MKKIFYILSIMVFSCWTVEAADSYKDPNQYIITDESNYVIFMYDLKNSLIQQFGQGNEAEGEMRAALVIGNLNLFDIKNKMILNMQKEHLTFLVSNLDSEKIERITKPFIQAVNDYISTVKSIELSDSFIHMYMQTPEFYGKPWIDDYPKHVLHNAESIAISRFDNKYWFNKIKTCYNNNLQTGDMIDIIAKCSQEYQQVVTEETGKILQQLEPYKQLFENLHQISPEQIMPPLNIKNR